MAEPWEPKEELYSVKVEEDIYQYIKNALDQGMSKTAPYIIHEIVWGIPCGPTLSMVIEEAAVIIDVDHRDWRM